MDEAQNPSDSVTETVTLLRYLLEPFMRLNQIRHVTCIRSLRITNTLSPATNCT
jgi:hypothetical protein